MTQKKEDILLSLCRPYILDLVSLLAEGLKHPDQPTHELTEGRKYPFTGEVLGRFNSLTYVQKAEILHEIAVWIESEIQKD
ncbi:hypothetical protein [Nostoc sp.]|uniref:hypothetical protein n=1 Tax=Nostoc sp. TaxID=1180 RepID=UPI002FF67F92